jgi:hypothetical protein
MSDYARIQCPFVYSNGKRCTGYVERFAAYHAKLDWRLGKDGQWRFDFRPGSSYQVYCSEKGDHSGVVRDRGEFRMKYYYDRLPPEVRRLIEAVDIVSERLEPKESE